MLATDYISRRIKNNFIISTSFSQLFATSISRSLYKNYQFQSGKPMYNLCPNLVHEESFHKKSLVIKNVETVESLKATLSLHHDIGTFVQSWQQLTLKGTLLKHFYLKIRYFLIKTKKKLPQNCVIFWLDNFPC